MMLAFNSHVICVIIIPNNCVAVKMFIFSESSILLKCYVSFQSANMCQLIFMILQNICVNVHTIYIIRNNIIRYI